jgi:1-aminocyclopropane-1-carboxylate deaminase/D-cysteine desulfhydrase-like pyridoxal-dependent ACC family enzyme
MIKTAVPLQKIDTGFLQMETVELYMYRLDMNHPSISGNKLFKLHYNLLEAKKQNKETLLTFGGAFSNHIAATAAAGKKHGLQTIGVIRGDEHQELNLTLKFAQECGMELHYVPRSLYRDKVTLDRYVKNKFMERDHYLIPEGGSNELGILGCKEIAKGIPIEFDTICCPCGTGATMAGITLSLKNHQKAIGLQVLKAENFIATEIKSWLNHFNSDQQNWNINEEYHFGGYAKVNSDLIDFIGGFEEQNNIPLDYIYTGKMMYGIFDLIRKGTFKKGETIVAVHTGGLQGNAGFDN